MGWATGASLAMAAVLCAPDARAQFYLGPEGGWTGLQGTQSSITGTNPVTGQSVTFPINQSFNSGFNVGARAGYQWDPWRFEGEYSYRQNSGNATSLGTQLNASVHTNSLMANVIYDFNLGWPLTPHIGMGLGAVQLDASVDGPSVGFHSKSSDVVFAYQAIAGVRYKFTPNLALDVDYRYRGTGNVSYTTNSFTANGVTFPSRTFSGSGNTNNVVASLTWLFSPPPPPPPMPVAAPAPPPLAPKMFIVFFDWDKDTVTSEGMAIIQQAAAAYRSGAPVQIQVTGYTDRSGSPAYNQRLSERRAKNVAIALSGMGVPQNQMLVSGRGENDNRVPTADGVREPQNRRVEITS
jgi:opacity protein-like surface antigen